MNLQTYFTRPQINLQEVSQIWMQKIFPHLPGNLESLAKQSGALQRKRGISSALDVLKLFFLYAVSGISFRMLAAAAQGLQISQISDTAWRKKFSQSIPFLHEVLQELLSPLFLPSPSLFSKEKNVLLVDGSLIRQQGIHQHQQRVHLCYSLNQNRIQQVKVTDHHTAESFGVFSMKQNDLILADAGYGTARNYAAAQEAGADVILRITPSHFSIFDADGEKISLYSFLEEAKRNKQAIAEIFGFCLYQKKKYFVRVIAQELPKSQAAKAKKRKKRKAQKNQYQIKEETLFYANYVVLITSLGVEYGMEEILSLYQSRWQVELFFKRFKQHLSITTIRMGNQTYAEGMVLLWLIVWILVEKQVILAEQFLRENEGKERAVRFSCWEKCRIVFLQTKEILCLSWSLFVDLKENAFHRFLSLRNRRRINQNEEFHTVILPGLIA